MPLSIQEKKKMLTKLKKLLTGKLKWVYLYPPNPGEWDSRAKEANERYYKIKDKYERAIIEIIDNTRF